MHCRFRSGSLNEFTHLLSAIPAQPLKHRSMYAIEIKDYCRAFKNVFRTGSIQPFIQPAEIKFNTAQSNI